jgi:N-acetylmuramoyl-L-alanine amidase
MRKVSVPEKEKLVMRRFIFAMNFFTDTVSKSTTTAALVKQATLLTFVVLIQLCTSSTLKPEHIQQNKPMTIVIDPGHGGTDPGCHGLYAREKDVTLAISLRLGVLLKQNCPDVKVVFTRTTDTFIDLEERAAIANRNKADLFVCIHCNANPDKTASGTETYLMGISKAEGNLDVAQRENSVILLEDNYKQKYNGFDPNSPEAYIFFSLYQNAHMQQSITLADKVESNYKTDGRYSRGVKQAGFWVLWRTNMPSILTETGFLTNPTEEKYLSSSSGQQQVAQDIFNAITQYKNEWSETVVGTTDSVLNVVKTNPVDSIVDSSAIDNTIIFKIQVCASMQTVNTNTPPYNSIPDLEMEHQTSYYKYLAGKYTDINQARTRLRRLQQSGFPDAFLVAYKNGKRISYKF